jgi:hypothetical protein
VGEEISRVMEKQQGLEARFESLISVRGVLKAMPNKTKYKAGLSTPFTPLPRSLLRAERNAPDVMTTLL